MKIWCFPVNSLATTGILLTALKKGPGNLDSGWKYRRHTTSPINHRAVWDGQSAFGVIVPGADLVGGEVGQYALTNKPVMATRSRMFSTAMFEFETVGRGVRSSLLGSSFGKKYENIYHMKSIISAQ